MTPAILPVPKRRIGSAPPEHYRPRLGPPARGNEDASIWLVFNGEIYNHAELRRQLVAGGPSLSESGGHRDHRSPVRRVRPECVRYLRGMFALLCGTDRSGVCLPRDRSRQHLAIIGAIERLFSSPLR